MKITKTGMKTTLMLTLAVAWIAMFLHDKGALFFSIGGEFRNLFLSVFNHEGIALLLTYAIMLLTILLPAYLLAWKQIKQYVDSATDKEKSN